MTAVIITKSFFAEISLSINVFYQIPENPTAKEIATFKEATNRKIPQPAVAIDGIHITILSRHRDDKK